MTPPSSFARLYGLPHAETLYFELDTAIEAAFDGGWETGEPLIIEEWTVRPPIEHLPTADHIVYWALEWAAENGESAEGQFDIQPTEHMIAMAEGLREAIVERVRIQSADRIVARHIVTATLNEHGEPEVVGEPTRQDLPGSAQGGDGNE